MNTQIVDQIVQAVLYEGYVLYPYRSSSKKNQRERFTFGRIYPERHTSGSSGLPAGSAGFPEVTPFSGSERKGSGCSSSPFAATHEAEPCVMQTQCLVTHGQGPATLHVRVGFLQPMAREVGLLESPADEWPTGIEPRLRMVPELRVGNDLYQTWFEAVERHIELPAITWPGGETARMDSPFEFCDSRTVEPISTAGGQVAGALVRRLAPVYGLVEISVEPAAPDLSKITVLIRNRTRLDELETSPDTVLMRTFSSAHTILGVSGAEFLSLMDAPAAFRPAAESCRNIGTWPVLVGDEARPQRDTMLSSPIILYDYPKLAPESAGPLFDGTEIDELLTLRIMTLSEEEKRQMRGVDEQARRLLERTEALPPEALLRMHGVMQPANSPQAPAPIDFDDFFGAATRLEGVSVGSVYLRPGDRVRLCPKSRADAFDLILRGQTAVIEAVEQDLERRVHLAVVLDKDPGKDLGLLRQPGHRFFFGLDEIEPLEFRETV